MAKPVPGGNDAGISLREMTSAELPRIAEIDRSEHITGQYRARGAELEPVEVDIPAPRWGEPGEAPVDEYVKSWRGLLEGDAVLIGAFAGDRLVGVAIYDRAFPKEPARFAVLYVTRSHRGRGIGARLSDEVVRCARADGAARLYVSATPTRTTVDFYRSRGFRPLDEPNEALIALEPGDIHLALPLRDEPS